jgi:hypothetical protein
MSGYYLTCGYIGNFRKEFDPPLAEEIGNIWSKNYLKERTMLFRG